MEPPPAYTSDEIVTAPVAALTLIGVVAAKLETPEAEPVL